MDVMMGFSFILGIMFIVMGIQVRMGKTEILGKNVKEQVKPELLQKYCNEMSLPMFVLGVAELADACLQKFAKVEGWSILIFGVGILLCLGWIMMIQKKYSK